jgi:hypothetical protein
MALLLATSQEGAASSLPAIFFVEPYLQPSQTLCYPLFPGPPLQFCAF